LHDAPAPVTADTNAVDSVGSTSTGSTSADTTKH
jgi:hypothetical protein